MVLLAFQASYPYFSGGEHWVLLGPAEYLLMSKRGRAFAVQYGYDLTNQLTPAFCE
jgi:hypothetical protein